MKRLRSILKLPALALTIALMCLALDTPRTQSPVWYGPFLSAAANLSIGDELRIDLEEVRAFADLSREKRERYSFQPSDSTISYTYNDVGFAYLTALAKLVFFWLGDQEAVEGLQILVHGLTCALIIVLLNGRIPKLLFLLLYALNPVVIRFVTFPFYYFWQVIPAFILILAILYSRSSWSVRESRSQAVAVWVAVILYALLLGLTVAARPSTIVIAVLALGSAWWTTRSKARAVALISIFVVVAWTIIVPTSRNFWFTVYVGLGAYPNPFGIEELSDTQGHELYTERTGERASASLGGNLYEQETMDRFREITRQEVIAIARSNPLILLRNALLNTLQGYSVGYINGGPPMVHYLVAVSGLLVLVALLWARQYLLFVAIGLSIGTFTLYYPPIPAYMYGAYPLLAFGAIQVWERTEISAHVEAALGRRFNRAIQSSA